MNQPVIIVGGGPVGLLLALELGRSGVPALVIEERPSHYRDLHVGTFHARLVEIFTERRLMGSLGEPPVWPAVHFGMLWLELKSLENEYNLLVSQTEIERLLESRAVETGATVLRGQTVTGFEQDADGVRVTVRSEDGTRELSAQYLVGADGKDSLVRRLAQIEVSRTGKSWYGLIGDFESYGGEFEAGVKPNGVFGALPEGGTGRWRLQTLEFDVEPPPDDQPATVEELQDNMERLIGHRQEVGAPMWMRRYTGTTQLVDAYRSGRVFLAGDAAHHVVPTASHGLSIGFADVVNLAWKLAAAVHGTAPAGLLDSYHEERHFAGRRSCQVSQAQMALMHPLDKVEALREIVQELIGIPEVNRRLVTWSTDIRYPQLSTEGDPLTGTRLGHLKLKTDGGETETATLLGSGRGFFLDLSGAADFGDLSDWSAQVDVIRAQPTDEIEAKALLVRPDGYVAWAGSDPAGLPEALATWFVKND